jgi:hypothetical protein
MLDGRAAYFTTLAPQFPEVADNKLIPLEYVLFVNHEYADDEVNGRVNRWQLGRLVDRIHLLDTVRLASLLYLPSLRQVGQTLSHLDSYINAAREAIDPNLEESNDADTPRDSSGVIDQNGRSSKSEQKKRDAFKHMETAHRLFARITREFNQKTETNTGILYRIERSRYYKEQFSKSLPALRLRRMEGLQKYDDFVERRQGPAFDFIDRLGRRYERATGTITALDQNYLAMETNHIDGIIKRIQQYGEFILFAALVPYYVIHILAQIVQENLMPSLAVGIWSLGFAIALYLICENFGVLARLAIAFVPLAAAAVVITIVVRADQKEIDGYAPYLRFWDIPNESLVIQRDMDQVLLAVKKNSEEIQKQEMQLAATQRNQLGVERDLLDVQKRSEAMQKEAMQLIMFLKELSNAQRNSHRGK